VSLEKARRLFAKRQGAALMVHRAFQCGEPVYKFEQVLSWTPSGKGGLSGILLTFDYGTIYIICNPIRKIRITVRIVPGLS
jgi:hypothetical protein